MGVRLRSRDKRQSEEWHTKSSPRPKKARMSRSRVKTMIIDVITSGNREILFRSHNATDLRRGQERFGAFRPAGDIQIPSALER